METCSHESNPSKIEGRLFRLEKDMHRADIIESFIIDNKGEEIIFKRYHVFCFSHFVFLFQ